MREHIKKDESGKVILTEIHKRDTASGYQGARCGGLERRFPEQFGRRDQMEHSGGKVKVQATQTQERKLTIELVNSEGEVYRIVRDGQAAAVEDGPEPEPS